MPPALSVFARLVLPVCLLTLVLPAHAATPTELPGGRDHPLISRFKGAVLQNAASESFASLRVPAGPAKRREGGGLTFDKAVTLEGQISSYYYVAPGSATPLEVQRSYQAALQQAGFSTLYSCEEQVCERELWPESLRRELLAPRPWQGQRINPAGGSSPRALRFISAKGKSAGKEVAVVVWITEPTSVWSAPAVTLIVAEQTAMASGSVTATLQQLQQGLKADGKIALYGLLFDTGRAEIKPESKPQLDEMAKLLQTDAGLRVFIVGHTDNQGKVDDNLSLSRRRAEAVVAALSGQYGIDAKRLSARGVANFAPVASNAQEAGRARNRRVELVVQ